MGTESHHRVLAIKRLEVGVVRMKIRLVILDGDGVLWDHQDLSALSLPFRLSNQDTIVDANGERVRLLKGVRKLLRTLASEG